MTVKSIYLVGSLRNPEVLELGNKIRALGIEAFDDWSAAGPEADDFWKKYSEARGQSYAEALNSWAAKHVFDFDREHLDRCDGVVLLLPAGRSCGVEFGYATGRGKPGWIVLDRPDRWDVMFQFARINGGDICTSHEDFLRKLEVFNGN